MLPPLISRKRANHNTRNTQPQSQPEPQDEARLAHCAIFGDGRLFRNAEVAFVFLAKNSVKIFAENRPNTVLDTVLYNNTVLDTVRHTHTLYVTLYFTLDLHCTLHCTLHRSQYHIQSRALYTWADDAPLPSDLSAMSADERQRWFMRKIRRLEREKNKLAQQVAAITIQNYDASDKLTNCFGYYN